MYAHALPPSGSAKGSFAGRARQLGDRVLRPVTRAGLVALAESWRARDLGGPDGLRRSQPRAPPEAR